MSEQASIENGVVQKSTIQLHYDRLHNQSAQFVTAQIKARSQDVIMGNAALFAAIPHELRDHYWFVFYSERMDTTWIMTSREFIEEAVRNRTGNNIGKRSIWFNGTRTDKATGNRIEYCKPQLEKFKAANFQRLLTERLGTAQAQRVPTAQ